MHGPLLATLIVAALLGQAGPTLAGTPDSLDIARHHLAGNDGIAAASILEDALPKAGPNKDAVLKLLRQAYEIAAKQADASGKPRDAETYRENLRILSRKSKATLPAAEPVVAPVAEIVPPIALPDNPTPPIEASPATQLDPAFGRSPAPVEIIETPAPMKVETPAISEPAASPAPTIAMADTAFAAENYKDAGKLYSALAQDRQLPANRREHWAYCRSVAVAERLNAHPTSPREWASIEAEIDQIRQLDPKNWLGEYLRNKASSLRASGKTNGSGKPVMRANSPEEPTPAPAPVDRPVRPASNISSPDATRSAGPISTRDLNGASRIGTASGRWQIKETANFRIYHANPELADKVAQVAEATRRDQTKRWTNALPRGLWQPQCEIYLYPTAQQYAQMTGQPEDSPGFSTMGMNEGRIISRRVNLKADHPTLLPAVLPHEIAHVILADYFTVRQIPRWADEGMAVLCEPIAEQARRAADLSEPLGKNVVFPVATLMGMDYPDPRYWALYYAQSVSLTRFLVEQGTPAQFVQFLQGSQQKGVEAELKRIYQIEGYADLEARWVAYARKMATASTPAAATASNASADFKAR